MSSERAVAQGRGAYIWTSLVGRVSQGGVTADDDVAVDIVGLHFRDAVWGHVWDDAATTVVTFVALDQVS